MRDDCGWQGDKHRIRKARKILLSLIGGNQPFGSGRKLHIGLDPQIGDITTAELTTGHVGDETAATIAH